MTRLDPLQDQGAGILKELEELIKSQAGAAKIVKSVE
jgi:hypothetical protein